VRTGGRVSQQFQEFKTLTSQRVLTARNAIPVYFRLLTKWAEENQGLLIEMREKIPS
jgi:hypothetical protein